MEKLKKIQVNNYELRTEVDENKEYLVVPVVMMVEGVHSGSHGAMYHRAEELGKEINAWNGIPVTIDHPQDKQGNYISANSPDQLACSVGRIFNAFMDGQKLKAEAWLDKQKLLSVSEEASTYIHQNRPLDVSVGVFTEELAESGEWNGETYTAIAQSYRPDHLALLPGGTGACSWADGCGIRTNESQIKKEEDMKDGINKKELNKEGYIISLIGNAQGYRELLDKMRNKLDALDRGNRMHFLEEVYDESIIYRVYDEGNNTQYLYKQPYTVNDAGEVTFEDNPVEVRREVEYITMSNGRKRTKFNTNSKKGDDMSNEKQVPCGNCMEKVVELINNKQTRFEKSDREWLLTQDESTLDKLFPKEAEPVQVNQEQAIEALSETLNDEDKVLGILPAEMKTRVELGLKAYDEQRSSLIKQIQANTDVDTWSEDDLKVMGIEVLQKIHKSVQPKGDYSGQGGAISTNDASGGDDLLFPMGVEVENK